jgi:hypothetical protein
VSELILNGEFYTEGIHGPTTASSVFIIGRCSGYTNLANFAYVPVPGDCLGFLKVELPLTKDWLFFPYFCHLTLYEIFISTGSLASCPK